MHANQIMNRILPQKVKQMLTHNDEFALLDVREEGIFSKGHLLFGSCLPLGRLELRIRDLVPLYDTPIILIDQDPSDPPKLAEQAARRLKRFGYTSVAIMKDGIKGWIKSGFEVFAGINVPSKAFGEFVEHTFHTPSIAAETLKAKMDRGENFVVLDARPKDEYRNMNIPGGIDTPGAELVCRVHDIAPDPETLVIVNCAGRTRSIIGAQSLINAGIPNPVVALKNGTMGWILAGYELEYGQERFAPPPSSLGLHKALVCANRVAKRFGIKKVNHTALEKWTARSKRQTLYLLDVRLPEAFEAGHLEGSRNAPGGQLVQATDEYVAVRNACIVLVDDNEVQATMTASWLVQMGWDEIYVLEGGIGNADRVQGPHSPEIPEFKKGATLTCKEVKALTDSGVRIAIVDLTSSVQYWQQHIPGAWWGLRSGLSQDLSRLPGVEWIVLTSRDGRIAHLAYQDLKTRLEGVSLRVLEGGTNAWVDGGLPVASGMERTISPTDDVWVKPYELEGKMEPFMRDYLKWETGLPQQIERDGDAYFRAFV